MDIKKVRKYTTTVGELIEALSSLPEDSVVILQRDAEGNGYSPMAGAEASKYIPESTYHGHCPHPDDIEDEEYEGVDMIDCVVIHPIN